MASTPQEDAERIRLKRLAKLQGAMSSSPSPSATPAPTTSKPPSAAPSTPALTQVAPLSKPPTPITIKRSAEAVPAPSPAPLKKKAVSQPLRLDIPQWENEAIGTIFNVTLSREAAEASGYQVVWLKQLAAELESEEDIPKPIHLTADIADRLLIARLELDPQAMSDDDELDFLPVLASLPPQQTVFEYLVGCWRRANNARSAMLKKNYPPLEVQHALTVLDRVRELVISYAGLTLQEPEMFPQPTGKLLGPPELVAPLITLSTLSAPLLSVSGTQQYVLGPSEVEPFLQDLARRFEPDNEIDGILGPVVRELCYHESLLRPEGIAGGDASWRGVIGGLEALVNVKSIANMFPRLPEWNPLNATAANIEFLSLFGPLLRLGVFEREWPSIAKSYFLKAKERQAVDIESSMASLRGTLKSLQSSMFQIFNALVRASAETREGVLEYFAHIVTLNVKRAGMQVQPETVATDSFMVNIQAILFRFCEPFMDANYTKIDRIDPLYYAHSNRIDLKDETRINADSNEAEEWRRQNQLANSPPNFISEIFYLTLAMNHYGHLKTISGFEELARYYDDLQRQVEMLEGDGSWRSGPFQARTQAAIDAAKAQQEGIQAAQLAFQTQLAEPELVFRSLSFTNFVSTWVLRLVDPRHKHPNPPPDLPLPKDVPLSFRVLPEYIIEDVVDYHCFILRDSPQSMELSGKVEMLLWALTFLTSTWYIKNPFLKAKIVEALFLGTFKYDGRRSVMESTLNTHPLALKYMIPALMRIYVEVEQTGASSQFYDKFNTRRYLSTIFRIIWDNAGHREALSIQTRTDMDQFVRFVNLMINDVTYLMDESLTDLGKIHEIQQEMKNVEEFSRQPAQYRREREGALRSLERQTSSYVALGNSTIALLKLFTAETKAPFMVPEIVDRLAAMLDYNLDSLVGPRCSNLQVKNPEKYKFNIKQLLTDFLQVFLNLADQGEFVRAVAADGRSYRKELFEKAAKIGRDRLSMTPDDIEKIKLFVLKVEEKKATLEAEDDLGDVPDEFLDPLMYTLMRDPVILPTSHVRIDRSTIKSHLLSDSTDPFNRTPLALEDVVPDVDLKARIDAFLAERRNKNTVYDKPVDEVVNVDADAMDTN